MTALLHTKGKQSKQHIRKRKRRKVEVDADPRGQSSVLYTDKFIGRSDNVYKAKELSNTYKLDNNHQGEKIGYVTVGLLPSYYDCVAA